MGRFDAYAGRGSCEIADGEVRSQHREAAGSAPRPAMSSRPLPDEPLDALDQQPYTDTIERR